MDNDNLYRSPLPLLTEAGEPVLQFSREALLRVKERMLEKIKLQGKLVIEESVYTEADIIFLLDSLDEENWPHHKVIYEQKGLRNFLESAVFEASMIEPSYQFRYKPSFVRFISAHYANAFNKASARLIVMKDFKKLESLFDFTAFILPEHGDMAFQSVKKYLEYLVAELNMTNGANYSEQEPLEIAGLKAWQSFMNKLPAEFLSLRDELVLSMLSVTALLSSVASVDLLDDMIIAARSLTVSAEIKAKVANTTAAIQKQILDRKTDRPARQKEQWLWWILGGVGVASLLIILVIHFKSSDNQIHEFAHNSGSSPAKEYTNAIEEISADDQMNSSNNERYFKTYLYYLSAYQYKGSEEDIATGTAPFDGFSILPRETGNSTLTVKNNAKSDVLLFFFGSNHPIVRSESKLCAVYIKAGDSYKFPFQPNFERINFWFGRNWIKLKSGVDFPIGDYVNKKTNINGKEEPVLTGKWHFDYFFADPDPTQFYLNHDITITNFEESTVHTRGVPQTRLVWKPPYNNTSNSDVQLILSGEKGTYRVNADGNLYVYESPRTFPVSAISQ